MACFTITSPISLPFLQLQPHWSRQCVTVNTLWVFSGFGLFVLNISVTQDSQLTVTLTALLRPSAPSHQYKPLFSLPAANVHVSDLFVLAAPPSGEHRSVCRTLFLTLRPGEKCLSIQPEELVWDTGQRTVKRSPLKTCLVLGVRVREWRGSSEERGGQRE